MGSQQVVVDKFGIAINFLGKAWREIEQLGSGLPASAVLDDLLRAASHVLKHQRACVLNQESEHLYFASILIFNAYCRINQERAFKEYVFKYYFENMQWRNYRYLVVEGVSPEDYCKAYRTAFSRAALKIEIVPCKPEPVTTPPSAEDSIL